jgi:hypothetical protein
LEIRGRFGDKREMEGVIDKAMAVVFSMIY